MLALVACLSLAVPAQAQTVLLDATMTVGAGNAPNAPNSLGYNESSDSMQDFGELSDNTFSSGGNNYTIDRITLLSSYVYLSVGEEISGIDDLTLTVKDKTFNGSDFTWNNEADYYWQGSQGLSLTNGETGVTVKITAPATATPALEFDPTSVTVPENGGMATYKVKLTTQPTHDVEVTVTSADTAVATVSSTVTLTSTTWNTGATVTVTGVNDDISNPGGKRTVSLSHDATSMDSDYSGKTGTVSVDVTNDDVPLAPTNLTASPEGNRGILKVNWTESLGANYYQFRVGTTSGGGSWEIAVNGPRVVSSLIPGGTYYLQVRGVNGAGTGPHAEAIGLASGIFPAPSNLAAAAGDGQLEVTWTGDPVAKATSHEIRYGTTPGAGSWAATTTNTSHTIMNLTNGTTYYVQVRGKKTGGVGTHGETTGTPVAPGTAPGQVTGLSATAGDSKLNLRWTAASGAASHQICHSTDQNHSCAGSDWVATTGGTSHRLIGLDNDTLYYVWVRGTNDAGDGATDETSGTPVAAGTVPDQVPRGTLSLTAGDGRISVLWEARSNVTGYEVETMVSGQANSCPSTTAPRCPGTLTVTDIPTDVTGLDNGTAYEIQVRAKNSAGAGAWSGKKNATPVAPAAPPSAPTGLSVTAGDAKLDVAWTAVSGATSHEICHSTAQDSCASGSWTATESDTSHSLMMLTNGTLYYVWVRGVNGAGNGAAAETSGTPAASGTAPGQVMNLALTAGNEQLSAAWDMPTGTVTGYDVEYKKSADATWMDAGHTGTMASHTISSLDNDTAYDVQVRAKNDEGEGGWSASATATPQGPGAGPQGLQFWEGDEELVAFWTAAQVGRYEMDWGTGWKQVSWGGASGYTIDGLTNGTEYTVKLRACEGNACGVPAIGKGTPTASPKPYGVPDVTVSAAGSGELALTWTAAEHATGYEFRYGERRWGLGASWHPVDDATGRTHTITGLDNWTEYMVEVRGVNMEGHGWAALGYGTPEAEGLHAPGHLTATGGNMKLKVTWGAVDAATSHEICHSATDDDCSGGGWTATTSASAHTVTGLTNGTMHYVWVRGVDGATKGPASEASGTPVAATEPPETPWLNAPDPGDGQVTVDWDPSQGGAEVEAYEVAVAVQGGGWSSCPSDTKPMCPGLIEATGGGDAREHAVTGLSNRKQYAFRVRATNVAGKSEWSATRYARPNGSSRKPYQVDKPTATPKDGYVAVSWTAPDDGGTPITGYDIQTAVKGGGWSSCPSTTPMCPDILEVTSTSTDIMNLTNGTHYAFRVRAKNAQGTGDWSQTAYAEPDSGLMGMSGKVLKQVLSNQARTLLEDATSVIGRRMADNQAGSDTLSAFAGLFGGEGPGGCTLAESIEDCVTRGASGGGGLGFGPGDRFGGDRDGGWSGSLSDLRGLVKSRGFAVSLNRPLPQAGAPFSQDASVPDEGMQLTFWGEGAASQSGGALFWGMDASGAGWMTGVAFAESGEGVTGALSRGDARVTGFAESEVSAVYPYAKGRFGSGLEVWSLARISHGLHLCSELGVLSGIAVLSVLGRAGGVLALLARCDLGSCVCVVVGRVRLVPLLWGQVDNRWCARVKTSAWGQAAAMAKRMRRVLRRICAPILRSLRRMDRHVALARRVPARAMRLSAESST